MELQLRDELLNFLKFASLVLDEFPKALRQAFKAMWDNKLGHRPGLQLWDDSTTVRKMFDTEEAKSGKTTAVPVHQSYNEWDCSSLFQATIFARCFASKGSTLKALYVKPVAHGSFHASVISSGGDNDETFALSIDQLRLLRNSLCHSTRSEMDKATFDQRLNYAKDAFHALGVSTALIDAVGSLTEADFPTNKVRQLENRIKEETGKYIKFLEEMSSDLLEIKASLSAIKQTVGSAADKEDIARLEQTIAKLQESQDEGDAKLTATARLRLLFDCEKMISLGRRVEAVGMEAQSMSQESARESLVSKQPQTVTTSAAESPEQAAAVEAAVVPGTSEMPRVEDGTGSWRTNVESGALSSSQDVLNLIASTYFQKLDPSTPEEFKEFIQYMEQVRKVVIVDVNTGSLEVIVQCSSLEVLEELWEDYSTGHLNEMAQKLLVTGSILKAFGLAEVKLTTTIEEEEYRACRDLLSKSRGHFTSLPGQYVEKMKLQTFGEEQLNFFKFASLLFSEFPKALRQSLKTLWDKTYGHLPGFQPWDDSNAVRKLFAMTTAEGDKIKFTRVPFHQSYNKWDTSSLFYATIFSRSFAQRTKVGDYATLSDLYVNSRAIPHGTFHPSVVSPSGNSAETFTLAIDQLRRLRNSFLNFTSDEMDKTTFDLYVNYVKDAFNALGVSTTSIDADGSLAESNLPENEVQNLEKGVREATREYMSSDVIEVKTFLSDIMQTVERSANKDDIAMLEQKIAELQKPHDAGDTTLETTGLRLPLPSMVSNFTGRQGERKEIIGYLTSESVRLVSIWGSPGFGKTSVALAVAHDLQSKGLPVCWVSLRGCESKASLTSKLLGFFRQPTITDQPSILELSLDDQLFQVLNELAARSFFFLDDADDLLGSRESEEEKDVTVQLIEEILYRCKGVRIVVTTTVFLEFMDEHIQGHKSIRIGSLDEVSAQAFVGELLPNASSLDCTRIAQTCGFVPLAIKLMGSVISEDRAHQTRQFISEFMDSPKEEFFDMLDNPDYPRSFRLKPRLISSFQGLTAQEQNALILLRSLPEPDFDVETTATVLGTTNLQRKNLLRSLYRQSFLDLSLKRGFYTMHKLIQLFVYQLPVD